MLRYRSTWVLLCHFVMINMIIVSGCNPNSKTDQEESLKEYFFSSDFLKEKGKEYQYISDTDEYAPPEIWIYRFPQKDVFESINVDTTGKLILRQKDKVVGNGVLVDSLILTAFTSDNKPMEFSTKILKPNRFSFAVDTFNYVTQMDWVQPENGLRIVLNRNRKFHSFIDYQWEGKKYKAVRLKVYDTLETEQTGWSKTEWFGYEIYALGLGLVHYEREVNKNMRISYSLTSINEIED